MLPPECSMFAVLSSVYKHPALPFRHNDGHYYCTFCFSLHSRTFLQNLRCWPFSSWWHIQYSVYCEYRYFCFPPTSSHWPLLLSWHWFVRFAPNTLILRRWNGSVVQSLYAPMVCILFLVQMKLHHQVFGNCPQGWIRLVEVNNLSEVIADLFGFSYDAMSKSH